MIGIVTNAQERTRFLKFLAVGLIGAVVDFGIMNLLTKLFALPLLWAGTISFVCAIISNFIWNRFWTYPDSRSRPLHKQLVMFFFVNIAGVLIRLPILHYLEKPLERLLENMAISAPFSIEFMAKNLTLAIAVVIVMLWNFFVNRYWTYNDVDTIEKEISSTIEP